LDIVLLFTYNQGSQNIQEVEGGQLFDHMNVQCPVTTNFSTVQAWRITSRNCGSGINPVFQTQSIRLPRNGPISSWTRISKSAGSTRAGSG
jgi:hypothetical protein